MASNVFLYSNHQAELERFSGSYNFVPIYGLGDRSSYFALLPLFASLIGEPVKLISLEGRADPLLPLFPQLNEMLVQLPGDFFPEPIQVAHWGYGVDRPTRGEFFFTWHRNYLDGKLAQRWEQSRHAALSHKNLIRHILGLPTSAVPSDISVPESTRRGHLIIAPQANSYTPPTQIFFDLATTCKALGHEVIWNVQDSFRQRLSDRERAMLDGFECFSGPLEELLSLCKSASLTISARSGLCELMSLARCRFLILNPVWLGPFSTFWNLDNWGAPPALEAFDNEVSEPLKQYLESLQ